MEPITIGKEIKGWKFLVNNNAVEYKRTKDPELLVEINHADIENIEKI